MQRRVAATVAFAIVHRPSAWHRRAPESEWTVRAARRRASRDDRANNGQEPRNALRERVTHRLIRIAQPAGKPRHMGPRPRLKQTVTAPDEPFRHKCV